MNLVIWASRGIVRAPTGVSRASCQDGSDQLTWFRGREMDFKRATAWAMALGVLLGSPLGLLAQETEEQLEAQIIFTHGPGGPVREDAVFQTEEDPYLFVWINGLRPRPEDHGRASISVTVRAHDPNGELMQETTFSDNNYQELFGPGAVVGFVRMAINGNKYSPEAYVITAEVVHPETGKRVTTSRKFWIKPAEHLSIIQYQFAYASDKSFAPGMFLQAGREHLLKLQLLNMMLQDGKLHLRVSTVGCDKTGKPYHSEAITHEVELEGPTGEGNYPIGRLEIPFTPNRAGQHLLRVTIEDLNSGEKTTRDIPCATVSVFTDSAKPMPTPPPGLLWMDVCLTQGEFGAPRQRNVYYANDRIYSQVRIAGLETDAKGKATFDLRVTITDETGTTLSEIKPPPVSHDLLHGKDVLEFSLWQATNFPKTMSGTVTWTIQVTDRVSGATGYASQQLVVNPDRDLQSTGHQFFLWEDSDMPAGKILHVGRPYHLRATIVGPQQKNASIDIEATLVGVDRQGNRLSGVELNLSQKIAISRFSEPIESFTLKAPFRVNRSGEYALRLIVTDKHSGQVSSEDIPITVVGQGPNDPVEKR